MNSMTLIALIVVVALVIYLGVALLLPERFS